MLLHYILFHFIWTENALKALTPASKKQAVERAVGVCKKVVSAFSNSWKRKRDLAKAQAVLGLPPHQLITENPHKMGLAADDDREVLRAGESAFTDPPCRQEGETLATGHYTLILFIVDSDYVCSLDSPPHESKVTYFFAIWLRQDIWCQAGKTWHC